MNLKEILRRIKKVLKAFFRVPKGNNKSIEEKFTDLLDETLNSLKENKEYYLKIMKALEASQERYKNIMRKMHED